jgi:hypothetical protein
VASAKISADDKGLEGVKDLLDAEGTGGRVIQANDGTLLVETTVPAGSASTPQTGCSRSRPTA